MPKHVYEKKTPREHVLLRPDMYIGSVTPESKVVFILNEQRDKMEEKNVTIIPGLLKIFDEILVNAIDNKQRDNSMSYVSVKIDKESGEIMVENDGKGIPVKIHEKYKIYIPELIFGHMLTSSNFDDSVKRVVGGRNGYGAKLANIFSTRFTVETCDGKKKFKQTHKKNMTEKTEPVITPTKKSKSFTRITFVPDFARFGIQNLKGDCYKLMERRVFDMAGVSDKTVKVKLNGEQIPVKSFKEYLELFVTTQMPILYQRINNRWEIGVSLSDGHFKQVSYVNSIFTGNGGRHCNYIADIIAGYVAKKKKELKPRQVKDFTFLFVNCLIENPAFKSQTKEELTTKLKDFGSKCVIPESFLKKVLKSQIVVEAIEMGKHKEAREKARKTDGKKTSKIFGITKLTDARHAGTKRSSECTLILVEGDSAKTLAIAGLPSIRGERNQHFFGVYPLRGKVLNVRDASVTQVTKNAEITNVKKILGLRDNVDYSVERNYQQLRYGKLMIMVDQDFDGSHIKGLIINFLHLFWPSLVKRNDFLIEFVTPIVVCKRKNIVKEFFTIPEYEKWKSENDTSRYDIKYYKGLGTSNNAEAEKYFSALKKHQIRFRYRNREDDNAIILAFSKAKTEDRKTWLTNFVPGTYLNHNTDFVTYNDFVNKELVLFSLADNQRSIPSMVDGLKPGQRKVLHTCLKRNITKSIKIPQLAGFVMSDTAYHHGDASLQGTAIKMAQCFVGSNNINLLVPNGQFGSRAQGGRDSANARYIFTHLSPATRRLFHKDDDTVLRYLEDDGISIEPEWFVPTLPVVLVNGSEGIGTGWSSNVPCFNPRDIIECLRAKINGAKPPPLHPWYRNWKGYLRQMPGRKDYYMTGRIELIGRHQIRISELPIKMWTENYKAHLAKLFEAGILRNILEEHSVDCVDFTIETGAENPIEKVSDFLLKTLKLTGTISMNNMVLFDPKGRPKRYESAMEILEEFFTLRLGFYVKRKERLLRDMEEELKIAENKARFIIAIVTKKLVVTNRPKKEIFEHLRLKKYDMIFKKKPSEATEEEDAENNSSGYDYLLSMSIWTLTMERFEKLKKDAAELLGRLEEFRKVKIEDIWLKDLAELEEELGKMDYKERSARGKNSKGSKHKNKKAKHKPHAPKGGNKSKSTANKKGYFAKKEGGNNNLLTKIITNQEWSEEDIVPTKKKVPKITVKVKTMETKKATKDGNKDVKKDSKGVLIKNSKAKIKKTVAHKKSEEDLNSDSEEESGEKCFDETTSEEEESGESSYSEFYEKENNKKPKKSENFGKLGEKELTKSKRTNIENGGESVGKRLKYGQESIKGFLQKDWNCSQCTFANKGSVSSCDICGTDRNVVSLV